MYLLNFAHPLTQAHLAEITRLVNTDPDLTVVDVPTQLDPQRPYVDQVRALVNGIGLTPQAWQTTPMLVNPPGHSSIAACLLAELHGRIGHFPAIVRMRPMANTTLPQFEVAEIINLQDARESARTLRSG